MASKYSGLLHFGYFSWEDPDISQISWVSEEISIALQTDLHCQQHQMSTLNILI